MNVLQIAKELGLEWKKVTEEINAEFKTSIKHYRNDIKDEHILFLQEKFSTIAEKDSRRDEAILTKMPVNENAWDSMPWDKKLRTKTKGHTKWIAENEHAWEAFIQHEIVLIKQERQNYINKMKRGK